MRLSQTIILCFLSTILFLTFFTSTLTATTATTNGSGSGEQYQFQAEISQLLSILINSLYSNRDIFLRELISNASDALNKLRFLALTNKEVLNTGDKLEIRIQADKDRNILSIRDTGVGMTKDDLINNLGTIAKSGTKAFLEKIKESNEGSSLIGQFGVGFYSAFLVADEVSVRTRSNDEDKQWVWRSKADSSFVIVEDMDGESLGRGTEILLHLKDDAKDFLDQGHLRQLIQKYSEFTHFPIYLYETKTETEEVPVEEEQKEETPKEEEQKSEETTADAPSEEEKTTTTEEEKVDVETEEKSAAAEETKPKTKKVEKVINEWNQVNQNKPIWTKSSSDITPEEYNQLFRSLSLDFEDPLTHIHFNAEGNVAFTSVLYVPAKAPQNMFDPTEKKSKIKLYVKRVFITDTVEDFLPRYLSFVRGIVDSDDLPLNVSREQLQQSKLLNLIKKKLVGKAIQMIEDLADMSAAKTEEYKKNKEARDAERAAKELTEDEKKELDKRDTEEKKEAEKYLQFWKEFGKNIRLGILEDQKHKNRLLPLLRYQTSKSGDELISLSQYVARMPENQKYIYYITGENVDEVKSSPFLEALEKRGFEVLFMVDAIDEYLAQQVREFEGKQLESITREGLKFGDEDSEDEKKKKETYDREFDSLTSFLGLILGNKKIQKAYVGRRVSSSPCVLVTPTFGISANMARIMKAQALGTNADTYKVMASMKMMEINPEHPVIIELNKRVKANINDPVAKKMAQLLYDTALLRSGYDIEEKAEFADRIFSMMSTGLHLDEKQESNTKTESKESSSHDEL